MAVGITDSAAYNRVLDGLAALDAARRRADSIGVGGPRSRTMVTDVVFERLSRSKWASPELRSYASRVGAGECAWNSIELATPIPPEVHELKADPRAEWPRDWPPEDDRPFSIQWQ